MKGSLTFAAVMVIGGVVLAEDWPQWRGPQGDGIVREEGLAEKWPDALKPLWTADAGTGFATPVAKEGKVYLFTMIDKKDALICYDAESGRELWRQSTGAGWTGDHPGPRATPTIGGGRIYTYGATGELMARDLAGGEPVWQTNILKETKSGNLGWGVSSSPLVTGEAVYVQGGSGGPVALRLSTADGSIKWKSQATGVASYAPPVLIDVDGRPQLIVFAAQAVVAMEPESGKTIWSYPWPTSYDVNAATPIYHEGQLFVTSGYGHGSLMLRVSKAKAEKLWESKAIMGRFVTPVLDAGQLYGTDEGGALKCLNWSDGKVRWEAKGRDQRLGMGGTYVRWGDKLIALGENGTLYLLKATPEGQESIGQIKAFQGAGEVWAAPIVSQGRLYVRGGGRLACFDISAKGTNRR